MDNDKTLLIIDIQYEFGKYMNGKENEKLFDIFNFLNENKAKINNTYNKIIQIVDNIHDLYNVNSQLNDFQLLNQNSINERYYPLKNGILIDIEDYFEYLGDKEDTDLQFQEYIQEKHYISVLDKIIYKEYGFFRDYMDYIQGSSDKEKLEEILIETIKILLKYNLNSTDEITEDFIEKLNMSEDKKIDYIEMFIEYGEYYTLRLPTQDLIDNILNNIPKENEIELIGGGKESCLKEIYFLLRGLGYENIILNEEYIYE